MIYLFIGERMKMLQFILFNYYENYLGNEQSFSFHLALFVVHDFDVFTFLKYIYLNFIFKNVFEKNKWKCCLFNIIIIKILCRNQFVIVMEQQCTVNLHKKQ